MAGWLGLPGVEVFPVGDLAASLAHAVSTGADSALREQAGTSAVSLP
jgi:hypothetical protein